MSSLVYHSAGSWYGAHKSVGATFRKSDCKMFDSQMIDPNNLLDLKRLIVAHMPEALCIDGSKNVFDYLNKDALENVDGQRLVKLPGAFMPYIDGDGNVVVTYGLQEIAAYDFGEVEVVIPKDDILPLLTEDGKMFF
jgi:hypothetical protein